MTFKTDSKGPPIGTCHLEKIASHYVQRCVYDSEETVYSPSYRQLGNGGA
jgi:hypothetical protein